MQRHFDNGSWLSVRPSSTVLDIHFWRINVNNNNKRFLRLDSDQSHRSVWLTSTAVTFIVSTVKLFEYSLKEILHNYDYQLGIVLSILFPMKAEYGFEV